MWVACAGKKGLGKREGKDMSEGKGNEEKIRRARARARRTRARARVRGGEDEVGK